MVIPLAFSVAVGFVVDMALPDGHILWLVIKSGISIMFYLLFTFLFFYVILNRVSGRFFVMRVSFDFICPGNTKSQRREIC